MTMVVSELLFFRLPLKPVHLLPVVAAVALMAGASPRVPRGLLIALVGAQLLGGVVGTTIGAPDAAHEATPGRLDVDLTPGHLLTMVQCRSNDTSTAHGREPPPDPEHDGGTATPGTHHVPRTH